MANFDLSGLALKSVCPNNEIFVDDADLPSVMVYIPKFKNSDVLTGGNDSTHPAFIVNGQEIPGFWYSKYQNVVHTTQLTDGSIAAAYSLPGGKYQLRHRSLPLRGKGCRLAPLHQRRVGRDRSLV